MKSTHIIFDMDGTLLNTTAYSIPACKRAAVEMGLPVPDDAAITDNIGYCAEEYYHILMPDIPWDTVEEYGLRVRTLEREGLSDLGPAILFPGAFEMLRTLRDCRAQLFVASTGEQEYVSLALEAALITSLFQGVEAGEPRKEAMAVRIRSGAPDASWAFVGDRFKDADAAQAANMPSIFAGWGFSPVNEGKLFTHEAHTMTELLQILGYGGTRAD